MTAIYTNPVLWEDLPDPEVIRVDDVYYMSSSSFHFSPGAPILKSHNLVDWMYVGHSIPELPPRERFTLDVDRPTAYGKGVWASTLKYRKSNGLFYFYSPIQGTDKTYIYTAKDPSGLWTAHSPLENFYYDLGLLIDDDDDSMYLAFGFQNIEVAQLSPDGLTEVSRQIVHTSEDRFEGARMYKIKDVYYIWITGNGDRQRTLKSTVGPFGPYEVKDTIMKMRSPLAGSGPPHQGELVDIPDGRWYYMAFTDAFPAGRVPLLAPVEFDDEGWPVVQGDYTVTNGQWLLEYPHPIPGTGTGTSKPALKRHTFTHSDLDPCWEWNHNPDNSKWRVQNGQLVLETASVTKNLYLASNTLTIRTVGPGSTATVSIDVSGMTDGDRAGLAMFRDESAYIGVHKTADDAKLVYVGGAQVGPRALPMGIESMNGRPTALDWKCISDGSVETEVPLPSSQVYLRVTADLRAAHSRVEGYEKVGRNAFFEYSTDGKTFERLGPVYPLTKSMAGFIGYRFGLFNFATKAVGGDVRVDYCEVETWEPSD